MSIFRALELAEKIEGRRLERAVGIDYETDVILDEYTEWMGLSRSKFVQLAVKRFVKQLKQAKRKASTHELNRIRNRETYHSRKWAD